MKRSIYLTVICMALLLSCNNKKERPTTAMDTGRAFIRATLDGDFSSAESLIYTDSVNTEYFGLYKTLYGRLPDNDKNSYRGADYIINKYTDVNDSVTLINYSNTYMKRPQDIKVIRKNGLWQIDLKYTATGDSLNN